MSTSQMDQAVSVIILPGPDLLPGNPAVINLQNMDLLIAPEGERNLSCCSLILRGMYGLARGCCDSRTFFTSSVLIASMALSDYAFFQVPTVNHVNGYLTAFSILALNAIVGVGSARAANCFYDYCRPQADRVGDREPLLGAH